MFQSVLASIGQQTDQAVGEAIRSASTGWGWWSNLLQNSVLVVAAILALVVLAIVVAVLRYLVIRRIHSGFAGVKEVFGRGDKSGLCWPGLVLLVPFKNTLRTIDLRVQLTPETASTQTKGGAMVHADVVIVWQVGLARPENMNDEEYRDRLGDLVIKAAYATDDLKALVKTSAGHALRAVIAGHSVEELAGIREKLATDVKEQLASKLGEFGVIVKDVNLTKVEPDAQVKTEMDSVTAAQFKQRAAQAYADAEKVMVVTAARAQAEAQAAMGQGEAEKIGQLIAGYVAAMQFVTGKEKLDIDEAGVVMLLLQHANIDMLAQHAQSGKANAVIHNAPQGGFADHVSETAVAIMAADSTDVAKGQESSSPAAEVSEEAKAALKDAAIKLEDASRNVVRDAKTRAEEVRAKLGKSRGGRFMLRIVDKQLAKATT